MPRGYNILSDVLSTTIDGVPLDRIWNEFTQTLEIVNRERSALGSLFTFDTTLPSDSIIQSPGGGSDGFEEASEFGMPKALRTEADYATLGFPLRWYDTATRYTEAYLRDATAAQVQSVHSNVLFKHNELVYTATLRALLTNTGDADRPVNETGAQIYSLWDGSPSSRPPAHAGRTFAPGHSHYLTSGSNVVDGQDLADLIKHLTHHGYGTQPGERIVLLVHPDQAEVIRGFRVGESSPFDFIPSEAAPAYLTTEILVGERPPSQHEGLPVIGSYGDALISQSYYLPEGYVIALASSGADHPRNPLAFRQHVRADYKGLRLIQGQRTDVPLIGARYSAGFGLGVRNRGAAAVMQITTDPQYTAPAI